MPNVELLLATIPSRRACVERLLDAISRQSRVPDVIHLCLEGYGGSPSPAFPSLPIQERRTDALSGPGARWRMLPEIAESSVLVVLDDDRCIVARDAIERLAGAASPGTAAACMGTDADGWGLLFPAGHGLISMGAASMAIHRADLDGLEETLAIVRSAGFDPFGHGGDDEAVLAAHLWKRGVSMVATGDIGIEEAIGSQVEAQHATRVAQKGTRSVFWQREKIRELIGWPWRSIGT